MKIYFLFTLLLKDALSVPVTLNSLNISTDFCVSNGNGKDGFCATSNYCSSISGGESSGRCSNDGQCCTVFSSCGDRVDSPVSYFSNPNYPNDDFIDSSCGLTVTARPRVCQIRVDFIDFVLPAPNSDGRCNPSKMFTVFAPYSPNGILGGDEDNGICGRNAGQHMYIPVQEGDEVRLFFSLTGNRETNFRWHLKITQVECGSDNTEMSMLEAPLGCLQYFPADSGTISSFNMDGMNRFSPSQNYHICFRDTHDIRVSCGVELRSILFGLPTLEGWDVNVDPKVLLPGVTTPCDAGTVTVTKTAADTWTQCCVDNTAASLSVLALDGDERRFHFCGKKLGSTDAITVLKPPFSINVRSPVWGNDELPDWATGFQLRYNVLSECS